MRRSLLAASGALALAGCGDSRVERVLLDARLEGVEIAVEESALVTAVSGGFELVIELGDLAPRDSVVEDPPSFTLTTAEQQTSLRVLDALPQTDTFPLRISPGRTERLTLVLTNENTLDDEASAIVCSESLIIAGSLRDAENGDRLTAFSSAAFTPLGCP